MRTIRRPAHSSNSRIRAGIFLDGIAGYMEASRPPNDTAYPVHPVTETRFTGNYTSPLLRPRVLRSPYPSLRTLDGLSDAAMLAGMVPAIRLKASPTRKHAATRDTEGRKNVSGRH